MSKHVNMVRLGRNNIYVQFLNTMQPFYTIYFDSVQLHTNKVIQAYHQYGMGSRPAL